jgi:uncharacterized protein with HEPN domain
MRPETASCLADARLACERITEITAETSSESYVDNWRTQSIIERLFTVIGEALVRIRDLEEPIFVRLPEVQRIIGFRNFLVHAYDAIDPARVYKIALTDVPGLLFALDSLLAEADAQGL